MPSPLTTMNNLNRPAPFNVIRRLFLAYLALFTLGIVGDSFASDVPNIGYIPDSGNYSARFIKDEKNISIISLNGNYDRTLPESTDFNAEPRAVIAREFYKTHQDVYDFLVVFTSFEFGTDDALAFHHAVRQGIRGIGREVYDYSSAYGGGGKLQGFIDMAALARYLADQSGANYDLVLQTLAHELMHQWAAFARFKEADGTLSDALLKGDGHWSFLLDSNASIMYGHHWRDNQNGTYTSVQAHDNFSPLDLYLMGLVGKEKVPPMTLLIAPDESKDRLPQLGVTIAATPKTITIDDIIAAEGPREPSVESSQKDFRFAFIYVTRPGEAIDDSSLQILGDIRREIGVRFNALTHGLATANVFVSPSGNYGVGTPEVTVSEEGPFYGSINLKDGVDWLKQQQQGAGNWFDVPATSVRDTGLAVRALKGFDGNYTGISSALAWIKKGGYTATDSIARQIMAVQAIEGAAEENRITQLLSIQNMDDGGWGFSRGYHSNPLDTALALQALSEKKGIDTERLKAKNYLVGQQNTDGGWGSTDTGVSRINTTIQVLLVLADEGDLSDEALSKAMSFISSAQNANGSFGDHASIHDTASVVIALKELGKTEHIDITKAFRYIGDRQQISGGWESSVYSTSLALLASNGAELVNWAVEAFYARPEVVSDGQPATLYAVLQNTGGQVAPPTKLAFYGEDPETNSGASPIEEVAVPRLRPGQRATVKTYWNTLGMAGTQKFFVVADPDIAHEELTRDDNKASLTYLINPSTGETDLWLTEKDISADPRQPSSLPAKIKINALLTNAGTKALEQVQIALWEGKANSRIKVGEALLDMPARATTPVFFEVALTKPGSTTYTIEIDPERHVNETDKENNKASVEVGTQRVFDLSVNDGDITVTPSTLDVGDDATFTVRLHNRGTVDSPTFAVRYSIDDGQSDQEIQTNRIQLAAGESTEQRILWRVNRPLPLTFKVRIDPDVLLEEDDRSNNAAQISVDRRSDGVNLSVNYQDIEINPNPAWEGHPLAIKALVRNTGNIDVENAEVAFYLGMPEENGGNEIAERQKISLAAGEDSVVEAVLPEVVLVKEQGNLLYVVIDPDAHIEETARDDNRAFIIFNIIQLPDLALSDFEITWQPEQPQSGETVNIEAKVFNTGRQDVTQATLRLYGGEPDAKNVIAEQKVDVPGQSETLARLSIQVKPDYLQKPLYLVIDPDDEKIEANEDNNKAMFWLNTSAQNGDFFVSERYFSPNGDGIKDTTTFFYRLPQPQDAVIEVIFRNEIILDQEVNAAYTGDFIWDGRREQQFGRQLADGDYKIQIKNTEGQILGSALTTLDTNNLSVLDALDSIWEHYIDLGCTTYFNSSEWEILPYNQYLPEDILPTFDDGVLHAVPNGSRHYWIGRIKNKAFNMERDALLAIETTSGEISIVSIATEWQKYEQLMLINHGTTLALYVESWVDNIVAAGEIWLAQENDRQWHTKLDLPGSGIEQMLLFREAEQEFVVASYAGLYVIPVSVVRNQRLIFNNDEFHNEIDPLVGGTAAKVFSPDYRKAVITVFYNNSIDYYDFSMTSTNTLRNLDTGIEYSLPENARGWIWSPNSRFVLAWQGFSFFNEQQSYHNNNLLASAKEHRSELSVIDEKGKVVNVYELSPGFYANPMYQNPSSFLPPYTPDGFHGSKIIGNVWSENSNGFYFPRIGGCENNSSSSYSIPSFICGDLYLSYFSLGEKTEKIIYERSVQSSVSLGNYFLYPSSCGWSGELSCTISRMLVSVLYGGYDGLVFNIIPGKEQAIFDRHLIDLSGSYTAQPIDADGSGYHFGENQTLIYGVPRPADYQSPQVCVNGNLSNLMMVSLQNLTAELRVVRTSSGAYKLYGTAFDKHFLRYTVEYANVKTPESWQAIVPFSSKPVADELLTTWSPPAPGVYTIRLTAEDRAGNVKKAETRVISTNPAPAVISVIREPSHISPNGDGVQDRVDFTYRVMQAGHIEFEVFNEREDLVRTFTANHPQSGVDATVSWDGRDQKGIVVPDGKYRINVLIYEFYVEVDNTPPSPIAPDEVMISLSQPFYYCRYLPDDTQPHGVDMLKAECRLSFPSPENMDEESFVLSLDEKENPLLEARASRLISCVQPKEINNILDPSFYAKLRLWSHCYLGSLGWSVEDKNLVDARIENSVNGSSRLIRDVYDDRRKEAFTTFIDALLYRNGQIDLVAEDAAGNRKTERANNDVQEIILTHTSSLRHDIILGPNFSFARAENLFPIKFGEKGPAISYSERQEVIEDHSDEYEYQYQFYVEHTIKQPIEFWWLEYREKDSNAEWKRIALLWNRNILILSEDQIPLLFFSKNSYEGRIVAVTRHEDTGEEREFVTPKFNIERSNPEELEVHVVDPCFYTPLSGCVLDSPLGIGSPPLFSFDIHFINYDHERDGKIPYEIYVSSSKDPEYRERKKIDEGVLEDFFSVRFDLPFKISALSCDTDYEVTITYYDPKNDKTGDKNIATGCGVFVYFYSNPNPTCNDTTVNDLRALLDWGGSPWDIDHLVLGKRYEDSREEILFNWVDPVLPVEVEINQSHLADDGAVWFTRALGNKGEVRERQMALPGDITPPSAKILSPISGGHYCGRMIADASGKFAPAFDLTAEIDDAEGWRYDVVWSFPAHTSGEKVITRNLLDLKSTEISGIFSTYRYLFNIARWPPSKELTLIGDNQYLKGKYSTPISRVWGSSGLATAWLEVANWAGQHVCEEVSFTVDTTVDVDPAGVNKIFSPLVNPGAAFVKHKAEEPVTSELFVYPRRFDREKSEWTTVFGTPAYHDADVQIDGETTTAWLGIDSAGGIAADGQYSMQFLYRDGCSLEKRSKEVYVTLDATPPDTVIRYPGDNDTLSMIVPILGDVFDEHIKEWELSYARASQPDRWFLLSRGADNKDNAFLSEWNAYGLEGEYILRLMAIDLAGNASEQRVTLMLGQDTSQGNIFTYAEAVPQVFSPNGDMKKDQTAVRYGLESDAYITIDIAGNGIAPRRLSEYSLELSGAREAVWDGKDSSGNVVGDGTYEINLNGILSTNPAVRQDITLRAMVDNTPPVLDIISPAKDVVRGTTEIMASVDDLTAGPYELTIRGPLPGTDKTTIETGDGSFQEKHFGDLTELIEENYDLVLVATDQADNTSEQVKNFTVDNTPPVITLHAPLPETLFGGEMLLDVDAEVIERHPKHWVLFFGQGAPPTEWQTLQEGDQLPLPEALQIDPEGLVDGVYTARLYVQDLADWDAEQTVQVRVDNTAPIAFISQPADGALVKESMEITGTAFDENFKEYLIELAPGGKTEATRWGVIAQGTKAVKENVLDTLSMPPEGVYTLRLTVIDEVGHKSQALVSFVVDTRPPTAPINLTAHIEDEIHVRLDWSASGDPDVIGYHIDRNGTRITQEPVDALTYLDENPGEGTHTYVVYAVDSSNWESEPSNAAEVTIVLNSLQAYILSPANQGVVSGAVTITGIANSKRDFKEYRLLLGEGEAPTSYQTLRRSPLPILSGELGVWYTTGLPEDARYTIRLEVEDTHGNEAYAQAVVQIDNLPPAKPTGLKAVPDGNDITVTWNPNTEPDLDGYLLYRDGVLVNVPENGVIGPLKNYLIKETTYLDEGVSDGEHIYIVYAMDFAGNISEPSDPASALIDNHPPRATIIQPEDGATVGSKTYLLATSPDLDIAKVQFEYRHQDASDWLLLGDPLTKAPYGVYWDPETSAYGTYEFRAVATDFAQQTDPEPPSISLIYADLQRPMAPVTLAALVDGGDVTLNWGAGKAGNIKGYLIERKNNSAQGDFERIVSAPIPATTYLDEGLEDAEYHYRVYAVGENDTVSDASNIATALVYTPWLKQPFTPIAERETILNAIGKTDTVAEISLANATPWRIIGKAPVDAAGNFTSSAIALDDGDNRLSLVFEDAKGNRSRQALTHVMTGNRPDAPLGVTAEADGSKVKIQWQPNQESDLWGYVIYIDGELIKTPINGGNVSSVYQDDYNMPPPENAADGDLRTFWILKEGTLARQDVPWFTYRADRVRQLTQAMLHWDASGNGAVPRNFDVEGWDGEVWVPLAEIRNNEEANQTIRWGSGYKTDRIRLRFYPSSASPGKDVHLAEMRLHDTDVMPDTQWESALPNGERNIAVGAVSLLGLVGDPSLPTAINISGERLDPPENLTVTVPPIHNTLDLFWDAPTSGKEPTGYNIYRSPSQDDGYEYLHTTTVAQRNYRDTSLKPGVRYYYMVRSVDDPGNESEPSNIASGVPTGAFEIPYLMYPATPKTPAISHALQTNIYGMATPGETVILKGTQKTAQATEKDNDQTIDISYNRLHWSADGSLFAVARTSEFFIYRADPSGAYRWQATVPAQNAVLPTISHDNSYLAFIQDKAIHIYRIAEQDLLGKILLQNNMVGELVWSFDGRLAFINKTENGADGIYMTDADFSGARLVKEAADENERFEKLSWSPKGDLLAYCGLKQISGWEKENAIEVVHVHDGSTQRIAADMFGNAGTALAWDRDGEKLYYVLGDADLKIFDLSQNTETSLDIYSASALSVSPDGRTLAYQAYDSAYLYDLGTGQQKTLADEEKVEMLNWLPGGYLTYRTRHWETNAVSHKRLVPAGHITFENVPLLEGENWFEAYPENREADVSAPVLIEVEVPVDPLPDFEIGEQDIVSVPGTPLVGEEVRLSIKIHNVGVADAPETDARITISHESGNDSQTISVRVPGLAASGTRVVSADWRPEAEGTYRISVSVDPNRTIEEIDETNNTSSQRIAVLREETNLMMTLFLSGNAFGHDEDVAGTFTVLNGSGVFNGLLEVAIEDEAGYQVTTLPDIAVDALAGGERRDIPATWNTGKTLPGVYRMKGLLRDAQGDARTEANALFTILAETLTARASVLTDQDEYLVGGDVQIYGTVNFSGVGATQKEVPVSIIIFDQDSQEKWRFTKNIVPYDRIEVNTSWATGGEAAGGYRAALVVGTDMPADTPLARAETTFKLNQAPAITRYDGELALSSTYINTGDVLRIDALMRNTGETDILALPVLITVTDTMARGIVAQERRVIDLALSGAQGISVDFDTKSWPLRQHRVSLQVDACAHTPDGNTHTLQQKSLSIFEAEPPVVSIVRPSDGIIVRKVETLYGIAYDILSELRSVEYQLDNRGWQAMQLSTPSENGYTALLPTLLDGDYKVAMRATDHFENTSTTSPVGFTIDTVPPAITITGVAQGGSYATDVTPTITVTDLHLGTVQAWLNGQAFTSGANVTAEGTYVLTVSAIDLAGNQSSETVEFAIDRGGEPPGEDGDPPVVTIVTPERDSYIKTAGMLDTVIVDAQSDVRDAAYRIGSGEWNPLPRIATTNRYQADMGTLADGAYTVSARATDSKSNTSLPVSVGFVVDGTPPNITVTHVTHDEKYSAPVSPEIAITDLNLASSEIRLNNMPYRSGDAITEWGAYVLTATATDKAGNRTDKSVSFALVQPDTTPPTVAIQSPRESAYLKALNNVEVLAHDSETGVKEVQYQVDSGAWKNMAAGPSAGMYVDAGMPLADGPYTLAARAADNGGNMSAPVTARFTVDATPPVIEVAGVEDGKDYGADALPLKPEITIVELNPDVETITLDGRPFVRGMELTNAASHVLDIVAIDKAGNRAAKTLRFTLLGGGRQDVAPTPIPATRLTPWMIPWYLMLIAIWIAFLNGYRHKYRQRNSIR